jgi:hypothetical protein
VTVEYAQTKDLQSFPVLDIVADGLGDVGMSSSLRGLCCRGFRHHFRILVGFNWDRAFLLSNYVSASSRDTNSASRTAAAIGTETGAVTGGCNRTELRREDFTAELLLGEFADTSRIEDSKHRTHVVRPVGGIKIEARAFPVSL